MAKLDMRKAQEYTKWSVEECRMAYRLQTKMFNCRANMPCMYKRDLACRACTPDPATGLEGQDETQEHLEVCKGYSKLWRLDAKEPSKIFHTSEEQTCQKAAITIWLYRSWTALSCEVVDSRGGRRQ